MILKTTHTIFATACLLAAVSFNAQGGDTINYKNGRLNSSALKESRASYAVYFTDTDNVRKGAAHIWDRSITFTKDSRGEALYNFEWKWYMNDTLISIVNAAGFLNSMKPLTHKANYFKRGKKSYVFNDNVVTVPDADKRTKKDSLFKLVMDPPAFEFPMDLELYGLLPFKNNGQKFVVAFYEPGTSKSAYYHLSVKGQEDLIMPGGSTVKCWLLSVDYGMKGSSALFWISDKSREVLKMKETYPGGFAYKVKLY